MDKKNTYIVILGDLKHSRTIEKRQYFAKLIADVIQTANITFKQDIIAPLTLTKGIDEFSGVLRNPKNSYKICSYINENIFPKGFRFVIFRGIIDINLESKDARIMDGPVFHKAAQTMDIMKKENKSYHFEIHKKNRDYSKCITELANLIEIIKNSQTKKQHEIGMLFRKSKFQKYIAEQLNISQQAISEAIRVSYWKELIRAEETLNDILIGISNNGNSKNQEELS